MKFMRYGRGCTRDNKIRYETISSDLNNFSINDVRRKYKELKVHVDRMIENRLP